jgi:hypothetical protein
MFLVLISPFKIINLLYDSIMSKEINVDLMKKHGFYFVSIVFWLSNHLIVL